MKYSPFLVPLARSWFMQTNLITLGSLTPFASMFEKGCDVYEQTIHDVQEFWMNMYSKTESDLHEKAESAFNKQEVTDAERAIMERSQPNYEHLRAAAQGEVDLRPIPDEACLIVSHSATAKSSHKYDEALRGRDLERHHG